MNSPKLARWILSAILPSEVRDPALGDLEEGYNRAASPRLWSWRQVAGSILPALAMRWRSPGVMRIGAAAIASYLVVAVMVALLLPVASAWIPDQGSLFPIFQAAGDMIAGLVGGVVIATLVPMAPLRAAKVFAVVLGLLIGLTAWMDQGRMPVWYYGILVLAGPCCVLSAAAICGGAGKRSSRS